nr:MAG TPA: hypothetical protein [Caudoviricetes sp.]DAU95527.1 MAG TPA: hypothetical protein [Caudoviricetes sp.]
MKDTAPRCIIKSVSQTVYRKLNSGGEVTPDDRQG